MPLPLSVLDLVPFGRGSTSAASLRASVELAQAVERLGYHRLWYAEHHNMPGIATTAPEILIAHVGQLTSRIRLGAGGVMLPNHSPLKVAETYRPLAALHPDRIDLGIGRAPGTDALTAYALRRGRTVDDFPEQLEELRAFGRSGVVFASDHAFQSIHVMPDDVPLPPIWLLGSSTYSAQLAADLGLGFAYAAHFSPDPPEPAMRLYRERFQPGPLAEPHAILALAVFCADTEREAQRMASSVLLSFARLRAGKPERFPSPEEAEAHVFSPAEEAAVAYYKRCQIVGTPSQVRARIDMMAERTQADEIMVATLAYDPAARLRSYELVAEAFRAEPPDNTPPRPT